MKKFIDYIFSISFSKEKCALNGGRVFAPSDEDALAFMKGFSHHKGKIKKLNMKTLFNYFVTVKKSTWIGVAAMKMERFYDPSLEQSNPLQEAELSQKVLANGTLHDEETFFNFGLRRWKGPCLYLKAHADYEVEEGDCDDKAAFICEWIGK